MFRRNISANEQLYLAAETPFEHLVIAAVVEGKGFVPGPRIENAMALVCEKMPGIRLRQAGKDWIANAPLSPVTEISIYPSFDQINRLPRLFSPKDGYTCDLYFAQDADRTLFVFRALHAVMDGKGLQIWMKAFFDVLKGLSLKEFTSTLTEDQLTAKAPIRSAEPLFPRFQGPKADPGSFRMQFSYVRRSLKGNVPALLPKLAAAIQKQMGCDAAFMIPVDLRTKMSDVDQESMANLSLPIFVELEAGKTWADFAQGLLDRLESKSYLARGRNDFVYRHLPTAALSWFAGFSAKRQLRTGRYMLTSVISQVGRVDVKDFSSHEFLADEIYFIPCAMPIAPFSIVITETANASEICLIQAEALEETPDETLDQILELAELAHLKRASKAEELVDLFEERKFARAHLRLHQLFEQKALSHPKQKALILGSESMSYDELNRRANQFARVLLEKGLKKGDFVAVGLERSFELIISILAAMKAGGVYVPLDPSLPEARLRYMIQDSKARFTVCRQSDEDLFRANSILLHLEKDTGVNQDARNLDLPIEARDLCYMIYTSGSTGNPKGAMNVHESAVNHFLWMDEEFKLGLEDRTLQKTPISFDASLLEILLPLQSGSTIVIAKPEGHKDVDYLASLIDEHDITFLSIVPSILNFFLDGLQKAPKQTLKLFLVGGEELTQALVQKIWKYFPNARIQNLYGPAEAAIDTVTFDCSEKILGKSVPIGKPIANIEAFVLGEDGRLIKDDSEGELILAGVGIGAGYFGQEALTREKFIDHPFHKDSQYKAYRTGDLVQKRFDGQFVFLGRIDNQVKIRGVRIELGEIEHEMMKVSGVNQAIVCVQESGANKTLIAYYSMNASQSQFDPDFRSSLKERLPDYMLPSTYIKLDKMPLNPSGKIDRKTLAAESQIQQIADGTVPEEGLERELAQVWKEILKQEVFRESDFFQLGGNSLMAISLVNRLKAMGYPKLHAKQLYETSVFKDFIHGLKN